MAPPDHTDQQPALTLAQAADRPYHRFVEIMHEGAAMMSSDGTILYPNGRLAEMLACPRESIVGQPLAAFVAGGVPTGLADQPGTDQPSADQPSADQPGADQPSADVELCLIDSTGARVPALVGSASLEVEGQVLTCMTFADLTAQKAQEREIKRLTRAQGERVAELQDAQAALMMQASHDVLTGLPNRALLFDRIDQALAFAQRSGGCTAVFFVDLDHFKQVNDTLGHAAGDLVLQSVASQLRAELRPSDTVARIGGDEFVILTPEVDNHQHARDISERLLEGLTRRTEHAGIAASVGLTVSVAGRGSAEVLLHEADTAMYSAKSQGGRRVAVFSPAMNRLRTEATDLQAMIQTALDERRVTPHYQPIVHLGSGRTVGFEALVRIIATDGTVLPPSTFIAMAETSGLIVPLGERVLGLACEEAVRWQATTSGPAPTVAVSLSGRQFEEGDMNGLVRRVLRHTGLAPHRLHLELTETAILDLHPGTVRQLQAITEQGVQIGLDHFGTGYASLTHLRRLPVDFVKVDQSFVRGLLTDRQDERIVSAVVGLAASLGLRSMADGVESRAQLSRLRHLGCDEAQGYLLARPMPAAELHAHLYADARNALLASRRLHASTESPALG